MQTSNVADGWGNDPRDVVLSLREQQEQEVRQETKLRRKSAENEIVTKVVGEISVFRSQFVCLSFFDT